MSARAAVLALALLCAGCAFQPSTASGPVAIRGALRTPSAPLTYGWVMVTATSPGPQAWGAQIGPKTDASGSHVAVWEWLGCSVPFDAHASCVGSVFLRLEPLEPGSVHEYEIDRTPQGWALRADGRTEAVFPLGIGQGYATQSDTGERTAA